MMATAPDDDLEAFFDEVSAAEAEAVDDSKQEDTDVLPAPKRPKTSHNEKSKPKRPMGGVVVAAASSVASVTASSAATAFGIVTQQQQQEAQQPNNASKSSSSSILNQGPTLPGAVGATTTATLTAIPAPIPPPPPGAPPPPLNHKKIKPHKRAAAGTVWVDPTLDEWPENDYRLFVGNLSKDVTDDMLHEHFAKKYPSVAKAKVVRDSKTGFSKGFGFVSLLQPIECARAMREMDQTWLSSRPIRVKKSDWKERELSVQRKKEKKRKKLLG